MWTHDSDTIAASQCGVYLIENDTVVSNLKPDANNVHQVAATYLTGLRGIEYRRDDNYATTKWYLYDGLGSVVGEVDPSGNVTTSNK